MIKCHDVTFLQGLIYFSLEFFESSILGVLVILAAELPEVILWVPLGGRHALGVRGVVSVWLVWLRFSLLLYSNLVLI
jgi:hypothetical protein